MLTKLFAFFGFGDDDAGPVITYEEQRARARQYTLPLENHYETMLLFGAKLRAARMRHRLTQRDLGKLVGATGNEVSEWERACKTPTSRQRAEVLALFGGDL